MDSRKSFMAGFSKVRAGEIKTELTIVEIEKIYPLYKSAAFAQGMIDALNLDPWRYNRAKINVAGNYGG